MRKPNPKLFQCSWKVSTRQNIPLQHPAWFKQKKKKNPSILVPNNYVVNQIKPSINAWDLPSLYNKEEVESTLNIPIPKSKPSEFQDKIIWPFSTNGNFQVKKAYSILLNENLPSHPNPPAIPPKAWKTLWKFPLPQ